MNYDYPVHRSKSLKEALRLVRYLKRTGEYDIFRGQNQNYPLVPSIFRGGSDTSQAIARLNQFASWVSQRKELLSLHKNKDAIMALAQHYGIPTTFLDFTTEPEVAAFFASQAGSSKPKAKNLADGCIICASRDRLSNSWAEINARCREKENFDLVRVVEIDVNNLWRLQAQSGLFLDVRADSTMLEMFSFLLHVEFPRTEIQAPEKQTKYYPLNKSHVELLLDQYFLIETYPEREKKLLEIFEHKIDVGPKDFVGELEIALATYICLAGFPAWETMEQFWGELIGVEMDGGNVRSRGFCGVTALTNALRDDFASYLVPKEVYAFQEGGIREALGMLIEPHRMFVFDRFRKVFAEQVIPSIVLERIEDVFHFNAVALRVFGLS